MVKRLVHPVLLKIEEEDTNGIHSLLIQDLDEGVGHALVDLLILNSKPSFAGYRRKHPSYNHHIIRVFAESRADLRECWNNSLLKLMHIADDLCKATTGSSSSFVVEANGDWSGLIKCDCILPSVFNVVRRILLAEIPTYAVTHCKVLRNTTKMCDESIIDRLSLIPIHVTTREKNEDEHDEEIQLTVKARLPKVCEQPDKNKKYQKTVTHNDVILSKKSARVISLVPDTMSIETNKQIENDDGIPLMILHPGSELHLVATAERGYGSFHAKFSAVSITKYHVFNQDDLPKEVAEYTTANKKCQMNMIMIGQLKFLEAVRAAAVRLHRVAESLMMNC